MIGKFRSRLEIYEVIKASDGIGGSDKTESLLHTVWGHLRPAKANEIWKADQLRQKVSHVLNIRFIDGLKTEMRIKFKGRNFDIVGIRDYDERTRFQELTLEEGLKK